MIVAQVIDMSRSKTESLFIKLTDRQDGTKNGRIFDCRTVPFVMSELKLAFGNAITGSTANVHHVVSVKHTQLFLSTGKPRDLVTNPGC